MVMDKGKQGRVKETGCDKVSKLGWMYVCMRNDSKEEYAKKRMERNDR